MDTAWLAHELRGPLASLRGILDTVRRTERDPELRAAHEMMERQIAQLVRIVDDLVDIDRIALGKLTLRAERLDLARILDQAVEYCRPFEHKLVVDLPEEPIVVEGDTARLVQVFGNLVQNACKFTPSDGHIFVTARRLDSGVIVSVRDTGVGIAPEHLANVFERFKQLGESPNDRPAGLGLGLTLVKSLVELHRGTVHAFSEGKGKGAEFVVRLPLPPDAVGRTPRKRPIAAIKVKAWRFLVVDDNQDNAVTLEKLLVLGGHEARVVHDGLTAVAEAERYRPDVVLLDIGLPRLNGYDACRLIREQTWGTNIVLVAVTGWGQEEDRRRSREAGFDGHLVKPVDLEALLSLLEMAALDRGPFPRPRDSTAGA